MDGANSADERLAAWFRSVSFTEDNPAGPIPRVGLSTSPVLGYCPPLGSTIDPTLRRVAGAHPPLAVSGLCRNGQRPVAEEAPGRAWHAAFAGEGYGRVPDGAQLDAVTGDTLMPVGDRWASAVLRTSFKSDRFSVSTPGFTDDRAGSGKYHDHGTGNRCTDRCLYTRRCSTRR